MPFQPAPDMTAGVLKVGEWLHLATTQYGANIVEAAALVGIDKGYARTLRDYYRECIRTKAREQIRHELTTFHFTAVVLHNYALAIAEG